jgi:hypothetical protein
MIGERFKGFYEPKRMDSPALKPVGRVLYQFSIEKQQTVGADLRVRPLWAHTWVHPYKITVSRPILGA